jgi:hypothetical protein
MKKAFRFWVGVFPSLWFTAMLITLIEGWKEAAWYSVILCTFFLMEEIVKQNVERQKLTTLDIFGVYTTPNFPICQSGIYTGGQLCRKPKSKT